jgi:hypothetical protein
MIACSLRTYHKLSSFINWYLSNFYVFDIKTHCWSDHSSASFDYCLMVDLQTRENWKGLKILSKFQWLMIFLLIVRMSISVLTLPRVNVIVCLSPRKYDLSVEFCTLLIQMRLNIFSLFFWPLVFVFWSIFIFFILTSDIFYILRLLVKIHHVFFLILSFVF